MSVTSHRWLTRIAAAAVLFAVAACAEDDPGGPVALVAPAGVTATSTAPTSVNLSWSAVADAGAYEVERVQGSVGGTFTGVEVTTATAFADAGLTPETAYRYRVRAVRGTDSGPYSAEASVTTSDRPVGQVTADITTNTTWTSTNIYQLTKVVSVANGAILTIEPGTRIIGGTIPGAGAPPVTALMVLRGSRIEAVGTAADPIVFTSSAAAGNRFPGDWGGLILVGNASSNRTGRTVVEGPAPADTVSWNGGNLDNDNSGSVVYTRVEFAGAAAILNVELNAYSMYAIGRSTRFEYNQAIRGLDDQFEYFGGTVDGRYLVSYESGDDHFDSAEGYRGRNQFVIALQTGPRVSPRPGNPGALSSEQNGFETDGCGSASGTCADGFDSAPYNMPVWANFTVIGPGPGVIPVRAGGDGGVGLLARRGTGGVWMNGVVGRWPESGLSIFDSETDTRITEDSLDIFNVLSIDNQRTFDTVGMATRYGTEAKFAGSDIESSTDAAHTLFVNVPTAATTIANGFGFDWRPAAAVSIRTGGTGATLPGLVGTRVTNFFGGTMAGTTYRGAVEPDVATPWYSGWTTYLRN
jgi:chitodextrinase